MVLEVEFKANTFLRVDVSYISSDYALSLWAFIT